MTTPQTIQKEIVYLRTRLTATDEELAKIVAMRIDLRRRLLSEVQKYQDAKLAEAQGKITEPCPACKNPEATCEHGVRDAASGLFVHSWNCPDCGKETVIVGYNCPDCLAVTGQAQAQAQAVRE